MCGGGGGVADSCLMRQWQCKPHHTHTFFLSHAHSLPLKQQKVIKYRAQTSTTGYQMTLKETGQRIGITRERVRQIQDRATEKLTELKDIFDELKTIQSAKFQAWHESLFSDNETHLHKLATLYLQTGATISEIQDQYKAEKLVNLIKESTTGPTSQKQIEEKAAKIEEQLAFNINKIISILKRVTTLQDAEFEDYFKSLFADDEQALAKRVLKAIQQTYTPAEVLNRIKINGITTQIIDSLNKDQVTLDMLQTKKEVVLVGSAQKDKKNLEAYRNAIRKGIVQTFKQASDQRTENPSKQIIKLEERQKPPANNQSTQNTETLERRLA